MAITNKALDVSEQKHVIQAKYSGVVATGATLPALIVPYACELRDVQVAVRGLSGSPVLALGCDRLASGGYTTILGLNATLALQAVSTSGPQRVSLIAQGSTLLRLNAGDIIAIRTGGTNAAVDDLTVSLVIQALQDIRATFGVSS